MEEDVYRLVYELESRHWWFRGREAVIKALLRKVVLPPHPRILDAGCGAGRNLQLYSRLGGAQGFDPSPHAVAFCRRRGLASVRHGTMEEIPFEAASFDLVTATDVLEHVADDEVGLREMRRVAAPGGSLILTVPAYRWLWSREDERLGHLRRYTRPALCLLARRSGWEPVFATYFNAALLIPIAAVRMLRATLGVRGSAELSVTPWWLDRLLALPMRLDARLVDTGARIPAGVSVGLIGRAI